VGVPAVRVVQGGTNYFLNPLDVFENLIIPEPKHLKTFTFEPARSFCASLDLFGMLTTIKFDDYPRREADEIDDIFADRRLPAQFEAINSLISQFIPKMFFSFCQVGT
jgi:hypothetical protein